MSIKNKKTTVITTIGLTLSAGFIIGIGGWFGGGATIPTDTMTRGLVGSWAMDEGFGSTAYDATTYQNNGSLGNGTAANMPSWTQGKVGGALAFDGVNDYVNLSQSSSLEPTSVITIESWIKPGVQTTHGGAIIAYGAFAPSSSGQQGWVLWANQDGSVSLLIRNGAYTGYTTGTGLISAGNWYHIVGTFNSGVGKIYLNGAEQSGSGALPSTIAYGTNDMHVIGMYNTNAGYSFNGLIDEVRIYNYARTQDQIKQDYNEGFSVRL